ncbi:MAG: DUF6089 family protein [Bacteroidia bacterium]
MYKIKTLTIGLCFFISNLAFAQFVEIGLLLGASNYIGDLSNETMAFKETQPSAALFGRYNISPRWAVKGFGAYGKVSGDDKNFATAKRTYNGVSNFEFNRLRNLNFNSHIYEFSVQMELNLLKNDLKDYSARPFIPYLFAGIGVFNFNPKTTLVNAQGNKQEFELQPLATEGQGSTTYNELKKYPLTAICVPVGMGIRQKIGDAFFLGIEGGIRFTNTNYLDDVGGKYADPSIVEGATGRNAMLLADRSWEVLPTGQLSPFIDGSLRSDKRNFLKTDAYLMIGVTLSYVFRGKGIPCPQF